MVQQRKFGDEIGRNHASKKSNIKPFKNFTTSTSVVKSQIFKPYKSQGYTAPSKVSAISAANTEKIASRMMIPLSSCIVPLQGDQEHGSVILTKEMTTMSPEKQSPSKIQSSRENVESCEVTLLNTSTNEIGAEFEYEKVIGTSINKI